MEIVKTVERFFQENPLMESFIITAASAEKMEQEQRELIAAGFWCDSPLVGEDLRYEVWRRAAMPYIRAEQKFTIEIARNHREMLISRRDGFQKQLGVSQKSVQDLTFLIANMLNPAINEMNNIIGELEAIEEESAAIGPVTVVIYRSWPGTGMGFAGGSSTNFMGKAANLTTAKQEAKKRYGAGKWKAYKVGGNKVGMESDIPDGEGTVYILYGDVRMNPTKYGFSQMSWNDEMWFHNAD